MITESRLGMPHLLSSRTERNGAHVNARTHTTGVTLSGRSYIHNGGTPGIVPDRARSSLLSNQRRQAHAVPNSSASTRTSRVRFTSGQQRSNSATSVLSASPLIARSSAAWSANSYIASCSEGSVTLQNRQALLTPNAFAASGKCSRLYHWSNALRFEPSGTVARTTK